MYGEIYYHDYCILDTQQPARVSIRKKGYSGPATLLEAGRVPFVKSMLDSDEDLIGGVQPTMATVNLIGDADFGMEDIYTASDSEYQVVHLIDGQVDWIGFMTPESFSENDTYGYRELVINCFDGLTRLKDMPFGDENGVIFGASTGDFNFTLLFAVKEALKKTGLQLDIHTLVDRSVVAVPAYSQFNVNALADGWVYSTGFNNLTAADLAVGNFVSYKMENGAEYTSKIVANELNFGTEDGSGVKLEPMMPEGLVINIQASFYSPVPDTTKDVLAEVTHDVRTWVDAETDIKKTSKEQEEEEAPYYEFSDGVVTAWDVLQAIAVEFDFRVTQNKGVWIVEAMDAHRYSNSFFAYSYDGVYKNKVARTGASNIPCDYTEIKFRASGATRYIDKSLKSVSVSYKYRYKTVDDGLSNLQPNGTFAEGATAPPAVFTPDGWNRFSTQKPITFEITKVLNSSVPGNFYINMQTPNQFNSFNGLASQSIRIGSGDIFRASWMQSIKEHASNYIQVEYLAMVIELVTDSGEIYYLVNYQDGRSWNDVRYTSNKPVGQWIRRETNHTWHFLSSYATTHNRTSQTGIYTPFSRVDLETLPTPDAGTITVKFVGVAVQGYRTGATGSDMYKPEFYARAYIQDVFDVEEQRMRYKPWETDSGVLMTFYKSSYSLAVDVADVKLMIEVSGSRAGGRLYEYTQPEEYFDRIDDVTIHLGDEDNLDHISVLRKSGVAVKAWTNLNGDLGTAPIGLMLARSIIRRYYGPKMMIDGSLSDAPLEIAQRFTFEDTPGVEFSIKQGNIASRDHIFSGTLVQNVKWNIPQIGVDYGPNSLTDGSSSGGSLSGAGGASQAWVSSQGFIKETDLNLQKVTEGGKVTTLDIKVRGTRNTHFTTVPNVAPIAEDIVSDETYVWSNEAAPAGTTPDPSGSFTISGAADASVAGRTNGQILSWNASLGKWVARDEQAVAGYATQAWVLAQPFGGITTTQIDNWNTAFTNSHTHANKAVLDGITSALISNWGSAYTHSQATGNPHGTTFAQLNSKPTTLAGYGITDVYTKTQSDARYLQSESDTLQTVTNRGKVTTLDIKVRGTRNTHFTTVPEAAPIAADIVASEVYVWSNETAPSGSAPDPSGSFTISGAADASVAGRTNGQILSWNASLGKWVAREEQTIAGYATQAWVLAQPFGGITSGQIGNWNTAFNNNHTHTNKAVLDGITAGLVTNWNTAFTNSHTHANKAVLDGITSALISNWNTAFTNNHTHINKSILDGIAQGNINNWNTAYNRGDFRDHGLGTVPGNVASDLNNLYVTSFNRITFQTSNTPTPMSEGSVITQAISSGGNTQLVINGTGDSLYIRGDYMNSRTPWRKAWTDYDFNTSDISNWDGAYSHSQITSGNPHGTTFAQLNSKPTTLAGFGITDAYTKTQSDTRYLDTLQTVTNRGKVTTLDIKVRGTRNTHFTTVPEAAPIAADIVSSEVYVWSNEEAPSGSAPDPSGSFTISGAEDASVAGRTNGQILSWNASLGKWVARDEQATMPTVGNGSLTIGTPTGLSSAGTFTANQSGNSTITLAYGTGYQGYTTAESNKLANLAEVASTGSFYDILDNPVYYISENTTGNNFGEKLQYAIDLVDSGTTIDARTVPLDDIVGGLSYISSSVTVSKPLTILLPAYTIEYTPNTGNVFNIEASNVNIIGTGRSSREDLKIVTTTIVMPNAGNNSGYHFYSRSNSVNTIQGMDLIGVRTTNYDAQVGSGTKPVNGSGGIYFEKPNPGTTGGGNTVSNCKFEDILLIGTRAHGIYIDTPILCNITNVRISQGGGHGIFLNGGTSTTMENCYVSSTHKAGFALYSHSYSALISCAAEYSGIGYWMRGCFNISLLSCGAESNGNRSNNVPNTNITTLKEDGVTVVTISDVGNDNTTLFRGSSYVVTGGVNISIDNCASTNASRPTGTGPTVNSRDVLVRGNARNVTVKTPRTSLTGSNTFNGRFNIAFEGFGGQFPTKCELVYDPVNDGTVNPAIPGQYMSTVNNAGNAAPVLIESGSDVLVRYGNEIVGYATETWVTQQINDISIPTVNDGQLTLSTGTGLSGSATFTANQSGNSTFSVSVASTHKLPTTAEWDTAYTNSHTHSNKAVLDGITTALITNWGTAYTHSQITNSNPHGTTFAQLNSKPTTIAGFGITDAPTKTGTGATGTWGIGISGNAASATKLATARTIWGQSFNGTGNVSGNLTGATNITASAKVQAQTVHPTANLIIPTAPPVSPEANNTYIYTAENL